MKIKAIFVSHLHGDHFLGIPGLLQTMDMSGRKDKILLAGPEGFGDVMERLIETCGDVTYDVNIVEATDGDEFEFGGFVVNAFDVDHGIPALGFLFRENDRPGRFDRSKAVSLGIHPGPDFTRLQNGENVNNVKPCDVIGPARKGRRVVYSGDTVKCDRIINMAKDADVLIHEATYLSEDSLLAEEHMHSTARDAASAAKDANVSVLFVTHMSNRYDDLTKIEEECRKVFPNTLLAEDLMLFTVK